MSDQRQIMLKKTPNEIPHKTIGTLSAIVIALFIGSCRCSEEVYVDMGKFDSKDKAIRAAIPKLATEIKNCPAAKIYRIWWVGPGDWPGNDPSKYRHAIVYVRMVKSIGYEDDFLSGISGTQYLVDEDAISAVAKSGGTLEDLLPYDQSRR